MIILEDITGDGTTSSVKIHDAQKDQGFFTVWVFINGNVGAGTLTIETSPDNTNWVSHNNPVMSANDSTMVNSQFNFIIAGDSYIRITTNGTSGTFTISARIAV